MFQNEPGIGQLGGEEDDSKGILVHLDELVCLVEGDRILVLPLNQVENKDNVMIETWSSRF